MLQNLTVSIVLCLLLALALAASAGSAKGPQPRGTVVFHDDLEKGVTFAPGEEPGWHKAWHSENVSIEENPRIAHSGSKCLKIHLPNNNGSEVGGYYSVYLPGPYGDETWVSYWIKYSEDFTQGPVGFMHVGETVINDRNGPPEYRFDSANWTPDGTNFAKVWMETDNNWHPTTPPGYVVTGWRVPPDPADVPPDAHPDYNWFYSGVVPKRGVWHHVLFKIRLNDPDKANGHFDFWYDGRLLNHYYGQSWGQEGLLVRKTPNLVVHSFFAGVYIHSSVQDNTVWLDDITITSGPGSPVAPGNLRAEKSNRGVKLTWDAVPGAKGYHIYRSEMGEHPRVTPFLRRNTALVRVPQFEDIRAATPGTAWLVTAILPGGESAFSKEARVSEKSATAGG